MHREAEVLVTGERKMKCTMLRRGPVPDREMANVFQMVSILLMLSLLAAGHGWMPFK